LLLRIDHVFVPGDWCADDGGRFPLTGSDHRGVKVTVGPCD
jgi:endonuclease/exonuclease/phosphatase (EEP) superfamily protein YafD